MATTYEVLIEPPAVEDIEEAYRYIHNESPAGADHWYAGIVEAILSLDRMPKRCALAVENDAFPVEIRERLYGVYRIHFTVRDKNVHVLHVRHGARRSIEP